jgi:anti-anti-sigma factor
MARAEPSYVTVAGRGVLAFVGRDADRTVVWLRGTYDLSSVTALAELMARAIAIDDGDLVVDLHQVQFIDAASVGVLMRVHKFLVLRSRSLVLRSPSRSARSVLDECGLTDPLPSHLADATATTGAAGALSTWVAVPATERVDPLDDESSPKPTTPRDDAQTHERDIGTHGTLVLAGDLDLVRVGDLRRELMAATKAAQDMVLVDLSQVSFIDSSCVGALLYANRVAPIHGCELILIAPSPACREALEQLGVSVLFTIREPAPADAVRGEPA